jgi:hypothetical protein
LSRHSEVGLMMSVEILGALLTQTASKLREVAA